jgi:HIRAN domain
MSEAGESAGSRRRLSLTKTQRATETGAELLSLCQTVTADGSLSDDEIQAFRDWLGSNSTSDLPAISFLTPVVERIVADGSVTADERRELFLAIEKILPQDVREISRNARQNREQTEREQQTLGSNEAKRLQREARELNRPIEHFDFMIAGAKYDGRPALIARYAQVTDSVLLRRDPANKYSRNATRVLTTSGHEIGFVPEEDATELAPLLDSGHPYAARIKKILAGSSHDIPVIVADIYSRDSNVPNLMRPSESTLRSTAESSKAPPSRWSGKIVVGIFALLLLIFFAAKSCAA